MKLRHGRIELAATDLSNHVACPHLTTLNLASALGDGVGYSNFDPTLEILQERGRVHEMAYVDHLRALGNRVEVGGNVLAWMALGVDVIVQAQLGSGLWSGRADFLIRVERPCPLWPWSYEVIDTKLAAATRAGTVLQLCVYSDLVAELQQSAPLEMHVVTPGPDFPRQSFLVDEYSAVYRAFRRDVESRIAKPVATYPEPTANCDTCNYRSHCEKRREDDDHLSLVADLGRTHQRELERAGLRTLIQLARVPSPWPHEPERGSGATYEKLAAQARLQLDGRGLDIPPYELLALQSGRGLHRLPAPSPGDVFLDFEGDPFIGNHGREYLFGWSTRDRAYEVRWATDDASESSALDEFIAFVMARWLADPGMHVYHFAPYEPTALKRLVQRYGHVSDELDRLLRGKRLVDLHAITRQTARIGVGSYSIKRLESLIGYRREVALGETGPLVHAVKLALQRGIPETIQPSWRAATEAYNRGDCESAAALQSWLESRRDELIAHGSEISRPPLLDGHPEEPSEARTAAENAERRLLAGVPVDREGRDDFQQARWLLGHLVRWYQREQRVVWWERFRLGETSDAERLDEQAAISGLQLIGRISAKSCPVDRYRFPPQDILVTPRDDLFGGDDSTKIGSVEAFDPDACFIDIKKTKATAELHPSSVFTHKMVLPGEKQEALIERATAVADAGLPPDPEPSLIRDLLLRRPPRGASRPGQRLRHAGETTEACAVRLVLSLDGGILPLQGPPGSGKTTTAAAMILALVAAGKRVGVAASSYAVLRNLLRRATTLATRGGTPLRAGMKADGRGTDADTIEEIASAKEAEQRSADFDVFGATCWHWARPGVRDSVDVLFIDEAGQLALADAVAILGATRNLVLVGDPQQLQQVVQGTHPDGAAISVLQHVVGDTPTIDPTRGLLLDESYRLHPAICAFTSEQFYARELTAATSAAEQSLVSEPFGGPGLYWHPVDHDGNSNRSPEEAAVVADLVHRCVTGGAIWTDADGITRRISERDILVVAPFNAHVAAIRHELARVGMHQTEVGTVDRFQGQEAAIAIYSMATSRPEDAPRGLAFLYDRHRLNVATSRARCASVVVASPRLLQAACSTPEHLHLVSALARFVELSAPKRPAPAMSRSRTRTDRALSNITVVGG